MISMLPKTTDLKGMASKRSPASAGAEFQAARKFAALLFNFVYSASGRLGGRIVSCFNLMAAQPPAERGERSSCKGADFVRWLPAAMWRRVSISADSGAVPSGGSLAHGCESAGSGGLVLGRPSAIFDFRSARMRRERGVP